MHVVTCGYALKDPPAPLIPSTLKHINFDFPTAWKPHSPPNYQISKHTTRLVACHCAAPGVGLGSVLRLAAEGEPSEISLKNLQAYICHICYVSTCVHNQLWLACRHAITTLLFHMLSLLHCMYYNIFAHSCCCPGAYYTMHRILLHW